MTKAKKLLAEITLHSITARIWEQPMNWSSGYDFREDNQIHDGTEPPDYHDYPLLTLDDDLVVTFHCRPVGSKGRGGQAFPVIAFDLLKDVMDLASARVCELREARAKAAQAKAEELAGQDCAKTDYRTKLKRPLKLS